MAEINTFLETVFYHMDAFIIRFYRMSGFSLLDYFTGTLILAFFCVIIGELSISVAIQFNKRHLDSMSKEMGEKERLSLQAYQAGDKESYKALNKEATDVWGRHFFTMVAYSAGILWPIPFALAWMQSRFQGIEFPVAIPLSWVFGPTVGYTFTFIPLYILSRIAFKYVRPTLPYFKSVQQMLDQKSA